MTLNPGFMTGDDRRSGEAVRLACLPVWARASVGSASDGAPMSRATHPSQPLGALLSETSRLRA
jgi:hypothetical protein